MISRALWIIPVAFGAACAFRSGTDAAGNTGAAAPAEKPKAKVPWFVGFFLLASVPRLYVPSVAHAAPALAHAATTGLTLTLFLIGAGLSTGTLRSVG